MNRFDDEDDDGGQVDGDRNAVARFVPGSAGQPWLRGGLPPWHMWGNTERIVTPPTVLLLGASASAKAQLVKVNYGRPETWSFLFAAKLIDAPTLVGGGISVNVSFEVMIGIGRSVVVIEEFARFDLLATFPGQLPVGRTLFETSTLGLSRVVRDPTESVLAPLVSEIVAQDINVSARVVVSSSTAGQQCTVEVSSMWGPKNHIRPDWYQQRVPAEMQFTGAEIQGR